MVGDDIQAIDMGPGVVILGAAFAWHALFMLLSAFAEEATCRAKLVSTVYSSLAVLFAIRSLESAPASSHSTGFTIASGYYLWAFAITAADKGTAYRKQVGALAHHIFCCFAYGLSLQKSLLPILCYAGSIFLLCEMSTIFGNLRWFAYHLSGVKRGTTSPGKSTAALRGAFACEVLFVVSFFATRILIGMSTSMQWWTHAAPRLLDAPVLFPTACAVFYMAANVMFNAVNVYWLCRSITCFFCRRRPTLSKDGEPCVKLCVKLGLDTVSLLQPPALSGQAPTTDKEAATADGEVVCETTVTEALDCSCETLVLYCQAHGSTRDETIATTTTTACQPASSQQTKQQRRRPFITRINGEWYDLQSFTHPGGPVARQLADGRDATALFVAHHPFTPTHKMEAVLRKYRINSSIGGDEAAVKLMLETDMILDRRDTGDDYDWGGNTKPAPTTTTPPTMPPRNFSSPSSPLSSPSSSSQPAAAAATTAPPSLVPAVSDPFEVELKAEVHKYFTAQALARGISFTQATKATPRRWCEITLYWGAFLSTVPALVRGESWALFITPVLCWITMVNYWHDACHFALSTVWWVNAILPYAGPWFSSPTVWYHQHVIGHHAYTNIGHKDPDLCHAPQLLREHRSVRWKKVHQKQNSCCRYGPVWSIAVGVGLHLFADAKLFIQNRYNRVVVGVPNLRTRGSVLAHLLGRAYYISSVFVWPWFVFESTLQCLIFSTVPIAIFSLLFMVNSQINHLTPETAHARDRSYYRHQVITAQDFGCEGGDNLPDALHRWFCFTLSGGLNMQIEHHLFPTVCHCHLASLRPIVSRLCAKHSVPYKHSVGYVAAMAQHLQHSKLMSRSDDPLDTTNANDGSGEAATAATPPFKRKAH